MRFFAVFMLLPLALACGESTNGETMDGSSNVAPDAGMNTPADSGTNNTPPDSGMNNTPPDSGMNTPPDSGMNTPPDSGMNNDQDSGVPADLTCNPRFGAGDACEGDVVGRWNYRAGCTDRDTFAAVRQICPGATSSNQASVASGTAEFTSGGVVTRMANTVTTAQLTIPAVCAAAAGGCSGVETAIENSGDTTATCSGAAACTCDVSRTVQTNDTGTYTKNGGMLTVIVNATTYQYNYCVQGGVFRYRGYDTNPDEDTISYVLEQ